MKTSDKPITIEHNDLTFLILYAGRYCNGRKFTSPSRLQSIIRKYWRDLSVNQQDIVISDIDSYIDDTLRWYPDFQNDNEYQGWVRLRKELTAIRNTGNTEEDYTDDSHGINIILRMLLSKDTIRPEQCEAAVTFIKDKLYDEGMWIGDDDHEAERFISFYGDELIESISV